MIRVRTILGANVNGGINGESAISEDAAKFVAIGGPKKYGVVVKVKASGLGRARPSER
jgi:hypothetical protein